jgi:hypothetical protein
MGGACQTCPLHWFTMLLLQSEPVPTPHHNDKKPLNIFRWLYWSSLNKTPISSRSFKYEPSNWSRVSIPPRGSYMASSSFRTIAGVSTGRLLSRWSIITPVRHRYSNHKRFNNFRGFSENRSMSLFYDLKADLPGDKAYEFTDLRGKVPEF